MDWIWIWVAVIALSLVVEFSTLEMVSLWTAVGGFIALILAALDVKLEIQLIVFFVVSIALLLSLRKLALKFLLKNSKNSKTGTDSLIGTKHTLLSSIKENTPGTIKINGVTWNTITENGQEIEEGTKVEIIRLEGNKFIVK